PIYTDMRCLFFLFVFMMMAVPGHTQPAGMSPGSDHARIELMALPAGKWASDAITLQNRRADGVLSGLHIELEEGWHTYWQNPGDSGTPVRIDWELPDGFEAGALYWPYPQSFEEGRMVTHGYKNESILLQPISAAPEVEDGSYELIADVEFLVCREACLPGFERLSLEVEVDDGRVLAVNESPAGLFERHAEHLPQRFDQSGTYQQLENRLMLSFPPALSRTLQETFDVGAATALKLHFYASAENINEASALQTFAIEADRLEAELGLSRYRNAPLQDEISGVLVATKGDQTQAYELVFTHR
ncbi:MAG: protein-disulfide reductase DsbD domain-containing protein, partial [Cyclonatronaceae bacterium]